MKTYELRSPEDIAALTEEWGFLPFFAGEIPGFSVEECCPPELWFSEEEDGPWEWKGPVARSGRCVYGKFFGGRAGFISREWLPDFANFRRDGKSHSGAQDLRRYKQRKEILNVGKYSPIWHSVILITSVIITKSSLSAG